ncbi:MAG: hypothetical protein GY722_19790 [bacterium]|nr:hypothetical protein [bacterium]
MKLLSTSIAIICVVSIVSAGPVPDELAATMVREAEALGAATIAGDFEELIDRTNPEVVAMMGGKTVAVRMTREAMRQIEKDGLTIESYGVSPPTALYESRDHQVAFLPTVMSMNSEDGLMRSNNYLIASRKKGTTTWYFLDGSGIEDSAILQEFFPGLPADVDIPERSYVMPGETIGE